VIYADTSFLFSFYAWDANTEAASTIYRKDQRRPLLFTPWQNFELRNVLRLASARLRSLKRPLPFQLGNVFKEVRQDLMAGRLRHCEPDWREALRLADALSAQYSESTGAASVDVWHVAAAVLLEAEVFWTFDSEQRQLASRCRRFRSVPLLPTS
jgi:hypothetical protein